MSGKIEEKNMNFLELKNIGKIYVAKNNVSIGIRHINLSFNKGEFVVITGKSGSGKTTLLNVISGMDSYEEGEILINGNPTSHYMQADWEKYRQNYISFIFQDYNIIDSFTVLQNVELALMYIKDKKERKNKAKELIEKVGLTNFINQRGSQLSGGQKQRTVIARALAKDSPIILADEPTGNLDTENASEIVKLLKAISKDKLVIVVTHSFSQFENIATREIRIYDGSIEIDNQISNELNISNTNNETINEYKDNVMRNGIILGENLYASKPKLAIFMSSLMIVGMLILFVMTSFCSRSFDIYKNKNMFNHVDGRLVILRQDEAIITDDELKQLQIKYNAKNSINYDYLYDYSSTMDFFSRDGKKTLKGYIEERTNYGKCDYGHYPNAYDEIMLFIPLEFKRYEKELTHIFLNRVNYTVTGIKYYKDNNLTPHFILSKEGYKNAEAVQFLFSNSLTGTFIIYDEKPYTMPVMKTYCSFTIPRNSFVVYEKEINESLVKDYDISMKLMYTLESGKEENNIVFDLKKDIMVYRNNIMADEDNYYKTEDHSVIVGMDLAMSIVKEIVDKKYNQASLFFENDREAKSVIKDIRTDGYIATLSNAIDYQKNESAAYIAFINTIIVAIWILSVLFVSTFLYLCATKSLNAFKNDLAIMRSMGLKTIEIKIAIFTRIFTNAIPSLILLIVLPLIIFNSPLLNPILPFLYWYEYLLIFIGVLLICTFIAKRSIKKVFNVSVKNALRGY